MMWLARRVAVSTVRGPARHLHGRLAATSDTEQFVFDLVKRQDYESYLIGLLVPKAQRRAFFALRGFNIEIATVKDQVPRSAHQAGRMRFQYWRDLLTSVQEEGALPTHVNQPVALELFKAIKEHNLQVRWLERCVEARQEDLLTNGATETYDDLETIAEKAHSSLLYLTLQLLGADDQESQYAASHVGVCSGIVTLLRGYPHNVQMGSICIPQSVLTKFQVTHKVAASGPTTDHERTALQNATHDMASQAYAHLQAARERLSKSSGKGLVALLPAVSCSLYLDALEKSNFEPFVAALEYENKSPLQFQWALVKASVKKAI